MAKKIMKASNSDTKTRPAISPEARENQLISAAVNLAEQQLRDGTASSAVIVHYLKLGTAKEKLELEKLRKETEVLEAKKVAYESSKNTEELFERAIEAMKEYSGNSNEYKD